MSAADEIVAVLRDLSLLRHGDPDALARRADILTTKAKLVERLQADEAGPAAVRPSPHDGATVVETTGGQP